MNTVGSLFQQAQLAEAAYANLLDDAGFLLTTDARVKAALQDQGNGMKFSDAQATAFATQWQVIDQYTAPSFLGLTGTGLSATLFKNIDSNSANYGRYTFAIRGSTPEQLAKDFRDDAALIVRDGIAVEQLVDLYNYWTSLNTAKDATFQAAYLKTDLLETAQLAPLWALAQNPLTMIAGMPATVPTR